MVSPTTLPAASSARSATWPRTSAKRPQALGVDLGHRLLAQPLDVRTGLGDTLGTRVVSGPLGTHDDLVRLPARLGEDGLALVGGGLPVATRGVGVDEALLDPIPPLRSCFATGLRASFHAMAKKTRKLSGADDDPEQVDRQAAAASALFRGEGRRGPDEAVSDGEQVHQRAPGPLAT